MRILFFCHVEERFFSCHSEERFFSCHSEELCDEESFRSFEAKASQDDCKKNAPLRMTTEESAQDDALQVILRSESDEESILDEMFRLRST